MRAAGQHGGRNAHGRALFLASALFATVGTERARSASSRRSTPSASGRHEFDGRLSVYRAPAHNAARGPVSILDGRLHAEF